MKNNKITLLLIIITLLFLRCVVIAKISKDRDIWFADITHLSELQDRDFKTLANYSFKKLNNFDIKKITFSKAIQTDKKPRIVFLSVSDGQAKANVYKGAGLGLLNATNLAISSYLKAKKINYIPKWLRLDIVSEVVDSKGKNINFDKTLFGFATDRQASEAFLSPEMIANRLITEKSKKALYFFYTKSYFADGKKVFELYRNHQRLKDLNNQKLLYAAVAAGEYFKRTVDENGKFVYLYLPIKDEIGSSYNILRHAGSIWSILQLYGVTKDKELLNIAKRGINYLKRQAKQCKNSTSKPLCIIERDAFKLGGNGLAAVAIAEYQKITGDETYNNLLLSLGDGMLERLEKNGNFRSHKERYSTGQVLDFRSSYYPGEAILALLKIYELKNKDKKWIDAAIRAAHYRINHDPHYSIEKRDHWFLYALSDLYRYEKNNLYLTHAFKIADYILQNQLKDQKYPDQNGAYFKTSVTSTATKSEAVCAAYKLAKDFGYTDNQSRYKKSLIKSIIYQLQFQARPELTMYFNNPNFALGGFYKDIGKYNIRNDYVQHNLSSIVCAMDL